MEYELIFGTITANESAEFIKGMDILNRKIGRHSMEQVDSKTSRVAITGLYSKDTDG